MLILLATSLPAGGQEKYLGTAREALVGVEVTDTPHSGPAQVRHGNGVVLRCDGFIAVPTALLAQSFTGKPDEPDPQTISIIANPGSPGERRWTAPRPPLIRDDVPYAVVKLAGFRAPALRTLLPGGVTDTHLELSYSRWDEVAHRFTAPQSSPAELKEAPHGDPGEFRLAAPVTGAPEGAVAAGPEGLGLGLLAASGDRVSTFARLNRVTNCVAPVPTTDAAFLAANAGEGGPDSATMLAVPGGTVRLPKTVQAEQRDMESETSACVAPFKIDRYEVTNREYREFWDSLPEAQRTDRTNRNPLYPLGWAATDPPYPDSIADVPVLGVNPEGAAAYAHFRGKRLPTPYEWLLASLGPEGGITPPAWVQSYLQARLTAWLRARDKHIQYYQAHPDEFQQDIWSAAPPPRPSDSPTQIPWIVGRYEGRQVSEASKAIVLQEVEALDQRWVDPLIVLPRGSRPFDTGPTGAKDVLLNAAELVVSSPLGPARGAPRYMESFWLDLPQPPGDPWKVYSALDLLSTTPWFQPASRLFSRNFDPSSRAGQFMDAILDMADNLQEAIAMIRPLSGWQIGMGSEYFTQAAVNPSVTESVQRTAASGAQGASFRIMGYSVWTGMPAHGHTEIGRHPSQAPPSDPVALTFLVPVGFRCAR